MKILTSVALAVCILTPINRARAADIDLRPQALTALVRAASSSLSSGAQRLSAQLQQFRRPPVVNFARRVVEQDFGHCLSTFDERTPKIGPRRVWEHHGDGGAICLGNDGGIYHSNGSSAGPLAEVKLWTERPNSGDGTGLNGARLIVPNSVLDQKVAQVGKDRRRQIRTPRSEHADERHPSALVELEVRVGRDGAELTSRSNGLCAEGLCRGAEHLAAGAGLTKRVFLETSFDHPQRMWGVLFLGTDQDLTQAFDGLPAGKTLDGLRAAWERASTSSIVLELENADLRRALFKHLRDDNPLNAPSQLRLAHLLPRYLLRAFFQGNEAGGGKIPLELMLPGTRGQPQKMKVEISVHPPTPPPPVYSMSSRTRAGAKNPGEPALDPRIVEQQNELIREAALRRAAQPDS